MPTHNNPDVATRVPNRVVVALGGNAITQADSDGSVSQDYVKAHLWLTLAASRFPPGEDQDVAIQSRDWVAAQMTPVQIAEAQKLAPFM